jgi:hypothetical protein
MSTACVCHAISASTLLPLDFLVGWSRSTRICGSTPSPIARCGYMMSRASWCSAQRNHALLARSGPNQKAD